MLCEDIIPKPSTRSFFLFAKVNLLRRMDIFNKSSCTLLEHALIIKLYVVLSNMIYVLSGKHFKFWKL